MRVALIALLLVACSRAEQREPTASWWCWPDTVCFAERTRCDDTARAIGKGEPCVAKPAAYCGRGCQPIEPGKFPTCFPKCAVDRYGCEMFKMSSPCREEAPPKRPELFRYSTPGFWCHELSGPGGAYSACSKEKEECDWLLGDTLAKAGLTRAANATVCARPTSPVYCWSRRVDGELAFVCTLDKKQCEATRANAPAVVAEHGNRVTDLSDCAVWAYD